MSIIKHSTAGCYLIRHTKKGPEVLIIYNIWSEDNRGWVLPKGHVEKGETLEQAALRETIEETGYQHIKIKSFIDTQHIEYPSANGDLNKKEIHWFYAELQDSKKAKKILTPGEKKRIVRQKWVTLDAAIAMLKYADDRRIITNLKNSVPA